MTGNINLQSPDAKLLGWLALGHIMSSAANLGPDMSDDLPAGQGGIEAFVSPPSQNLDHSINIRLLTQDNQRQVGGRS